MSGNNFVLKPIRFIAMLVLLLTACGSGGVPAGAEISTTEAGNTLIVTEEFSAVILSKEFLDKHSYWPPTTYWTPEVEQVLLLESKLEEYLAKNNSAFNFKRAPDKQELSTYGRQYFGLFHGEEPKILGGFFCSEIGKDFDWKDQMVDVAGGGDCFFSVWYDPATKEFFGVGANAPK